MELRLSAALTPTAHAGLTEFARWYGFTVAAFLEALGRDLHNYEPPRRLPPVLSEAVKGAREISEERRRRPK